MKGITFKVATIGDIPMICKFRVNQLARGGTVKVEGIDDELIRFYNECFEQDTIWQIFAYENEKAVATGAVLFYSYPPSHVNKTGKIAYISNMFTDPDYRNRGIATQILTLLEDEARKRGITTAKLGATSMGKSATAMNEQLQRIFVLKSPEALEKVRNVTRMTYNAPVVLLICYDKNVSWKAHKFGDDYDAGEMNAGIVTTTMMMQAAELGVGSLWVRGYCTIRLHS